MCISTCITVYVLVIHVVQRQKPLGVYMDGEEVKNSLINNQLYYSNGELIQIKYTVVQQVCIYIFFGFTMEVSG